VTAQDVLARHRMTRARGALQAFVAACDRIVEES